MIAIASDHAGYELKEWIKKHLDERGLAYRDYGTDSPESCDYPKFGEAAARAIVSGEAKKGIVICGTGIGISLACTKIRGIRCALCGDCYSAELSRRHNDANMIALGARVVGGGLALKLVDTFLDTPFDGGKHARRLAMIATIENKERS